MQMVSGVVVVRGFLFGAVVDDEEEDRFIENLWRAVMNLSSDPSHSVQVKRVTLDFFLSFKIQKKKKIMLIFSYL